MITLLIVFQIILTILICIAVLLQKSSNIGLGSYSGSNESLFGAKGPAGFLAKFTFALGILLIANTISLSYLYNISQTSNSIAEKVDILVPQALDTNNTNVVPEVPSSVPNAPQDENVTK